MVSTFTFFPHLKPEIRSLIIRLSDPADWDALSQTCREIRVAVKDESRDTAHTGGYSNFKPQSITGLLGGLNLPASIPSSVPSACSSDDEALNSTDTELSSPEEQDWEFEVTPEMMRRLSCLPQYRSGASLPTLPSELQLEIFSYLDQIDSTCFGLSSPRTYTIFRAIHGVKMPLNTRRNGPNKLEAAWEIIGKQQCRHCGMFRCELHEHIKSWMPKKLEYCSMKKTFGVPANEGANATCYRGKPSKPRRCGRHPIRTTTIHQDDMQSNF